MKNIINYSKVSILIGLAFTLSTCKKDKFLNVNNNPNYPATATVNLVLPTCEANIAYMLGNTMGIYGGLWAQYWTQDPTYGVQYGAFDQYINVPTDNDNLWLTLYTTATNLNYIIATADTAQKNYAAVAYFLKAYDFQLLCDAFGPVPLSQALQGKNNLAPAFDNEQQVYDSLVVWINDGMNMVDRTKTSPVEDLLYPSLSMSQWQKFANTLLLKIYIRECLVAPTVAQAGIHNLTNQMSTNGTSFMSVPGSTSGIGDDATMHYIASTFQQFPLYATGLYLQARNITGSATCVNYLVELNDPRLSDFYALDYYGGYGGELQGDWAALSGSPDYAFSPPSNEILSATSSTRLITTSESFFLQAEAVARHYMTGSAGALYNSGIQASFKSWISSDTSTQYAAYINSPLVNFNSATTLQSKIQLILTQKWVSMCGNQNFEAWTGWRRTRYPSFFTPSASSEQPAGDWPLRLVYPSAEILENTSFPGEQPIYQPVWWDINH